MPIFDGSVFDSDIFDVGDEQSVSVELIDQTATAYTPSLVYAQDISVGFINQTAQLFSISVGVSQDLTVGLIDQTATTFNPTIARPITFIGSIESIRTTTVNPWSFTANSSPSNTGSGNNYQTGHVLSIVMTGSGGNMVTGVTFKGYPMTQIVTAEDPTGEPGFASLWFISGIERGPGTCTVTLSSATTNDFQFTWMSFASQYILEVIDSDSTSGDIDDPSVVLSTSGRESLAVASMFSGLDAPGSISELGTMTLVQDHDFGTTSAEVARQTTRGTTDFTAGFTTTAADDVALVALLLAETDNQLVGFGLIPSLRTLYEPALTYDQFVTAGFINQTAVAHAPSAGRVVSLGLIDRTTVAFDVHVNTFQIEAPLISNPATTFTPSVQSRQDISFGRIDRFAYTFNPSFTGGVTPAPTASPATVIIRYDGQNITEDVVIVGANFTSQANGVAGTCQFKIKDPGHTYSLTTGKRLTLDINGQRVWTGYVSKVSRVYAFKAENTSNPSLVTRFLQVDGVDINILFRKRIVFEKANPKRLFGRKYTADNTDDTVAFADLVEDFLDLSGDNLDTSTLIENVGTINVDHPANPIGVGHDWGSSMRSITALSNAVYYIDPDRRVVLTDVDTPNAPFDLSDDPADLAVGYREMEVLYNASNMVNDAIVWGAGGGSGTMVYSREEDATSISTHGRWQYGEFRTDMYKQGTVNRRADSIVQGSAQSKRGAKNDQVTVSFVTYEPGLRVAQKVDFRSAAFGFQDVLPIRRMTVNFLTPTQPKYTILAGHEIDMPWGFFDIWRPSFGFPGLPGIDIPDFNIPGIDIDIPDPDADGGCECTDEICGITDTFSREVAPNIISAGLADAGMTWVVEDEGFGSNSVEVSDGVMTVVTEDTFDQSIPISGLGLEWTIYWKLRFNTSQVTSRARIVVGGIEVRIFRDFESPATGNIFVEGSGFADPLDQDVWYTFRLRLFENGTKVWMDWWPSDDPEPAIGGSSLSASGAVTPTSFFLEVFEGAVDTASISFDDLDVNGINSCSEYRFDTFNRTVSGSLGTSDAGLAWSGSHSQLSVDGSSAKLTAPANTSSLRTVFITAPAGSGAPWATGFFTMDTRFKLDVIHTEAESYNQIAWFFERVGQSGLIRDHHSVGFQISNDTVGGNSGRLYFNNSQVASKTDWVADAWYRVKYECESGVQHRYKLWLESDGEPVDWSYTLDDTGEPVLEDSVATVMYMDLINFRGGSLTGLPANNIWVDYIDFDYEGKPCNGHSETLEVLDDFNRSIAVANGPGLTNQWGDTSGTGDPWTNVYDTLDILSYGVDGSVAIARFSHNGAFTTQRTMMMTLNEGGSGLSPFFTVGAGAPDELFDGTEIDWAIDFMVTDVNSSRFTYIEVIWADNNATGPVDGVTIGLALTSGTSGGPYIGVQPFSSPNTLPPTLSSTYFQDNVWYTLRVQRSGTVVRGKVWQRDSAEPGWMHSAVILAAAWTPGEFTIWGTSREINGVTATIDFNFDNLRLVSQLCGVSYLPPIASSGRVCENFTGDGVTTDFFTSQTQTYGQTSVSIDGRFKTLFEYNQILNEDDNLSGVRMTLGPPAAGAIIRVCYNVGEGLLLGLGPV